jgi:hypothetical protein
MHHNIDEDRTRRIRFLTATDIAYLWYANVDDVKEYVKDVKPHHVDRYGYKRYDIKKLSYDDFAKVYK